MKKRKLGQGLVEYALLIALLALVTLASVAGMGDAASKGFFSKISSNLSTANSSISGN